MSKTLLQAPERSPRVPEICAGIAAGIALLALLGWVSGVRFLAGELGTYIPMAPSTALAFLLLSGALFIFVRLPVLRLGRLFELTAVSIVLLIGLLVLAQFIFGIDFGIEQVLSRTNELLGSTPLGRMSPLTAIAFLLEGAAFFILLIGERWRNVPTAVALLAASATAINTVVLIGYAFGAPLLYGGTTIPVALPTAIAFVLVGMGQFNLAAPGVPALREWSGASMRGILLRAFLPFLLIYILLDSWADLAFAPMTKLNPAVWYSLKVLSAGALIVITIGWIARRKGGEIERAQKALRDSETRYRNIMERSVEAIYLYDVDNQRVVAANPAFLKILGYKAEEVAGLTLYDIVAADRDSIDGYIRQILAEGGISMGERLWRRKDGTIFPVEVTSNKIQQSEGDLGFVVARDITERKQAEANQLKLLEDAEKRIKQLTVLHEVAMVATQVDTIDQLIECTTEIIGKSLFPDNFGILLMDEEKGVLHPHPSYRFVSAVDLVPIDVSIGQGITGQVAKTGQPIRIGSIAGIQNYIEIDQRDLFRTLCANQAQRSSSGRDQC